MCGSGKSPIFGEASYAWFPYWTCHFGGSPPIFRHSPILNCFNIPTFFMVKIHTLQWTPIHCLNSHGEICQVFHGEIPKCSLRFHGETCSFHGPKFPCSIMVPRTFFMVKSRWFTIFAWAKLVKNPFESMVYHLKNCIFLVKSPYVPPFFMLKS